MIRAFFRFWTPKQKWQELTEIDRSPPSFSLSADEARLRVHLTVFWVCVCLLALNYGRQQSVLLSVIHFIANLCGTPADTIQSLMANHPFGTFSRYAWWALCHGFCYIFMPYLFIKTQLKQPLMDFGWRWNNTHHHWQSYAFLAVPIITMAILASHRSDFSQHYPFYRLASRSWADLLLWEACYFLQFIALEFFFRGFILQALRPAIGASAIWVMVPPYLMIHFTKPWLEATGAIFFGLFLGLLALRSSSIWGGFFVHCGVALSMDIAALYQAGVWPNSLWPL